MPHNTTTAINSTTVLQKLTTMDAYVGHAGISIESLAVILDISVNKLVSLLTELEHRDEITMEISTIADVVQGGDQYTGTVRLMRHAPGEDTPRN